MSDSEVDENAYIATNGEDYFVDDPRQMGDVVIMTDGKEDEPQAWRMDKGIMMMASPIFKEMLDKAPIGTYELVTPEADHFTLNVFVRAIEGIAHEQLDQDEWRAEAGIKLAIKYKATEAAKFLLSHSIGILSSGDATSTSPSLSHYRPIAVSLIPFSPVRPWSAEHAGRIDWVWLSALVLATQGASKATEAHLADRSYWRAIAGDFLQNSALNAFRRCQKLEGNHLALHPVYTSTSLLMPRTPRSRMPAARQSS
ncbi:uncharacterized protein MKK02DRAFT_40783 [Dioszegia hungarica]|uniref:BTB domain-containing protein n=1 Tax=Dioszegia hungarica TaxID=4972 RepID=A0AA38H297_9TREE|nr:uncharacterized protein MKK02DRAFT_40783 [Dioszegia hungarica]KAI9632480.1 hypothetical protein MKK02DRAFT_40783 [Dioszegia hungarica]